MRLRQRGAALLAAMLTVTLVATFAAAALWQQWRALEVETAERARVQAAWLLLGALDWSRLILVEDANSSGADHLTEPWAVPLQEARLSTFLAAENNVSQSGDATIDTNDAFLSGQITDLQSRLNLRNLISEASMAERAELQFSRLFERLNLPQSELALLISGLRSAASANEANALLMPQSTDQLGWLGLSPITVARLEPHVTMLPQATPLNVNTASVDVLWAAIDGIDQAGAQKIVQARETRYFATLADVRNLIGAQESSLTVRDFNIASAYFEVRGQLRLDKTVVQERSLVHRGSGRITTMLWRQRAALPLLVAPAGGS
jgi:general secretion pathway protein K